MCVRHTPPLTHPEFSLKLGHRAGNAILIVATLAFATPMVLVGVANGSQGFTATSTATVAGGRIEVPDPKPPVVADPEDEPQLRIPVEPAPPPQLDVPDQDPTQPVEPSPEPAETTEPSTPPTVEIPKLPDDLPTGSTEPAPEESTGP